MKEFDEKRARHYRAKGHKVAVLNAEPAVYGKPSWADQGKGEVLALQPFGGPHFTVSVPMINTEGEAVGWDVYGSDAAEFRETHTKVAAFPLMPSSLEGGIWVKRDKRGTVIVEAYQLTEEDVVLPSAVVFGGTDETSRTTVPAGHYRIRQPGGEIQDTAPRQFEYLYEPDIW